MRFTTEVLPLLSGQPGVAVEVSGEPADYREAGDSLRIGVSTAEVAGDNDWFDLGVTIRSRAARSRSPTCSPRSAAASRTCCSPTAPTSPGQARAAAAGPPDRGGPGPAGGRRRDAADQPVPGRAVGRAGRARRGRPPGPGVAAAGAGTPRGQPGGGISGPGTGSRRPPCGPGCVLTSWTGSGWLAFLWQHQLGGILADDMGLGKTLADARADLPRPAGRPGRRAVPDRRADQRGAELGGRGGPVRTRPEGRDARRHAGPQRRRPGRAHRGRRRRGHLVHAAAARLRRLPAAGGPA